jgi:NitT/TauT family transport system substrate-binding protein
MLIMKNLRSAAAWFVAGMIFFAIAAAAPVRAVAEQIKIGIQKATGVGPIFIAQEKGYFAAEGLTAELVFFESAQPVAVAVVSGDIDFGVGGITAGFYSLASQGALTIIAAAMREAPDFQAGAYVVGMRAYDAGLKSFKDLPGHSVAIPQIGSAQHYALGLLAQKYGLDLQAMRLLPLQSNPNVASAVIGGQADAASIAGSYAMSAIQRGDVKLLGWVGDETPWQLGAAYTATKTANERHDIVARFLRAYRKGVRDHHDAFTGPGETRKDGPTAPDILAIFVKYVSQPVEVVKVGIPYYDAEARLDVRDVLHQVDWYKSQGLLKGPVEGNALIDKRYVVSLPER